MKWYEIILMMKLSIASVTYACPRNRVSNTITQVTLNTINHVTLLHHIVRGN